MHSYAEAGGQGGWFYESSRSSTAEDCSKLLSQNARSWAAAIRWRSSLLERPQKCYLFACMQQHAFCSMCPIHTRAPPPKTISAFIAASSYDMQTWEALQDLHLSINACCSLPACMVPSNGALSTS